MSKKILIIATNAKSLINFRYELIKDLLASGFEVVACAPGDKDWHKVTAKLNVINVRLLEIKLNNTSISVLQDLIGLFSLCKRLKQERPSFIFNYSIKSVIYGSMAAYFSGVKNIYSMIAGLGYAFSGQTLKAKLVNRLVKILYKIALVLNKKVFFQNPDDASLFINKKLVKQNQVVLVNGSGVDTNYFQYTSPPTTISFLFVGRLLRDKGIYEYLAAARQLKLKYPHIDFKVAGGLSPNPASISATELKQWQQAKVVEYLGFLEDIRPALQNTAVFVLPSYREGTPRSGLEALAVGRAVVTTSAPGCKEIVQENYNGYLVPVKDEHALATAMEKFILEPELAVRMGNNSRQLAIQKFDVYKVNSIIISQLI